MVTKMMEESEVNIGRFFTITSKEPIGSCRAELKIDLTQYKQARSPQFDSSAKVMLLEESERELLTYLSSFHAPMFWQNMLKQATLGLEEKHKKMIQQAPVSKILEKNFIELVKNTLDVAIMTDSLTISLFMEIDYKSHNEQLTVRLYDTGNGFPLALIDKLSTKEGCRDYMDDKGSNKKSASLTGGAGKGLRRLLAMMNGEEYKTFERYSDDEYDKPLKRKPRFVCPEGTSFTIGKRPDNQPGAFISLTTSKKAWVEIEHPMTEHDENEIKSILTNFDYAHLKNRFLSSSSRNVKDDDNNTDCTDRHSI